MRLWIVHDSLRGPLTFLEHRKGVEPSPSAWKANVLTVKYDRCMADSIWPMKHRSHRSPREGSYPGTANRLLPVCYGCSAAACTILSKKLCGLPIDWKNTCAETGSPAVRWNLMACLLSGGQVRKFRGFIDPWKTGCPGGQARDNAIRLEMATVIGFEPTSLEEDLWFSRPLPSTSRSHGQINHFQT